MLDALAGLRADESRSCENECDHDVTVGPATSAKARVEQSRGAEEPDDLWSFELREAEVEAGRTIRGSSFVTTGER